LDWIDNVARRFNFRHRSSFNFGGTASSSTVVFSCNDGTGRLFSGRRILDYFAYFGDSASPLPFSLLLVVPPFLQHVADPMPFHGRGYEQQRTRGGYGQPLPRQIVWHERTTDTGADRSTADRRNNDKRSAGRS
jgi:hypothetical protein